jgi:N-acetyl-gamma-glutamyl-phosphate reductase common form
MSATYSIGIVGARGHTGAELIRLVARHPRLDLGFVSSRELDGQPVTDHVVEYKGSLRYSAPARAELPDFGCDVVVLALPNGKAGECVAAFDAAGADPILVDLSADYRFDDDWHYGLPELNRSKAAGQRRIANPGCYATAMQLALAPVRGLLDGPAQCFGVSGYSGAGTTPSPRNDAALLRDNLMPYSLIGHIHEREVSRHLGHPVEFLPHVAAHFRGITMTVNTHLADGYGADQLLAMYRTFYAGEPLVSIQTDAPWVSAIANRHGAIVGGFASAGDRAVIVSVIDNLLKGAATQAMQNINIALGLDEFEGIPT